MQSAVAQPAKVLLLSGGRTRGRYGICIFALSMAHLMSASWSCMLAIIILELLHAEVSGC